MIIVKIKKHNKTDIIMALFVIILMAFRDYSILVIGLTLVLATWLVFNRLMSFKIKKGIVEFSFLKILFIVLCMLSSFWGKNPSVLQLCISMVYRLLICFCVLLYVETENDLIKLIKMIIIGALVLCLRMIIVVPIDAWGNARVGLYLSHDPDNTYGNTGITYVLGVLSAILIADKKDMFFGKRIKYILIAVFTLFSLMSGSKKQFFILVIAMFIVLVIDAKQPVKKLKNLLLFIVAFFVTYYMIFNIPALYNAIGYRLESFFSFWGNSKIANMEDLSTLSRISFINDAIKVFANNPVLGVGIDSFKYYNSFQFSWSECNYLEMLADVGIIGFVVYYLPHIRITKSLLKKRKSNSPLFLIILVLFVVLLFIDLTMVSYNDAHLQFYLAIIFSYCVICKREGKYLK